MKSCIAILSLILIFTFFPGSAIDTGSFQSDSKSLKKSYKELVLQGHKLYEEGALPEALSRYEEASQLKQRIPPKLRYRMASLYYLLDDDEKVIDLLKHRMTLSKIPETYFLLGLCYKDLNQFDRAQSSFRKYLEKDNIKKRREALLELADISFKIGDLDASAAILSRLAENSADKSALLAFAKILISQGNLAQAERILRENVFGESELYEYAYLMGELAMNRGNYKAALDFFTEAKNHKKATRFHLAEELLDLETQAYLFLTDDWRLEPSERFRYWSDLRKTQLERSDSGDSNLTLAHFYLVTYNLFGDPVSREKAFFLLKDDHENKPRALFLQARLAASYQEKDRIFRLLTAENKQNPYVLKGWYLRGLNDLVYGQKNHNPEALNRACYEFEIVWKRCLGINSHLAGLAIKSHIQAHLAHKTKKGRENALKLSDAILANENLQLPNQDEIFYLRGLAAVETAPEKAIKSFEESIRCSQTNASTEALFALGACYYEREHWKLAEETFLNLANTAPTFKKTPEALYFAAQCRQRRGKEAKGIKKRLYENYPLSPFAAEAYLTFYPQQDYIKGMQGAINHLAGMPDRFPDSPWIIEAYFILGLDLKREHRSSSGNLLREQNLSKALDAFQNAEAAYGLLDEKGHIDENRKSYFYTLRCRAMIERALTQIQIAERSGGTKKRIYFEYANDLLKKLIHDVQLSPLLANSDPYPPLLEECEYNLAHSHIKMNEDREAEDIFSQMQKKYRKSKITRGFYLCQVHFDLAKIAKRKGKARDALEELQKAEDAARGNVVTSDKLLDIWIEQSLCYLTLGDDEKAMRILSKVINQDVASAKRLKAMYLRSNIYESQGREELALRQLQALAKQQGEWAAKAKEKLKDYD